MQTRIVHRLTQWWAARRSAKTAQQIRALIPADPDQPIHEQVNAALKDRGVVHEPASQSARFTVERIAPDGHTYYAYIGDEGHIARAAWESYGEDGLPGRYTFYDTHAASGHRGTFSRGVSE